MFHCSEIRSYGCSQRGQMQNGAEDCKRTQQTCILESGAQGRKKDAEKSKNSTDTEEDIFALLRPFALFLLLTTFRTIASGKFRKKPFKYFLGHPACNLRVQELGEIHSCEKARVLA